MIDLKIRYVGDPVLRKKTEFIQKIDDSLINIIEEMYDLMYKNEGIGLAAPQVGISKRFFILDNGEVKKTVINPVIIVTFGEKVEYEEGCLSVPEVFENLKRPEGVKVKYLTIEGEEKEEEHHKYISRVFQHETDHLEGKLFIDYFSSIKRARHKKQLKQIRKEGQKRAKEMGVVNI